MLYRNEIIGGVYVYEYDTQQASLLLTLQNNLMTISVGVAVLVLMLSLVFSRQITSRLANLLNAIRGVREGAYNQRAVIIGGGDDGPGHALRLHPRQGPAHVLLRQLVQSPADPEYILTKWGVGSYFKG